MVTALKKNMTFLLISLILTGCGPSKALLTPTLTSDSPILTQTASSTPRSTDTTQPSLTPTTTPVALEVPQGNPPTLDGLLSPDEWDEAIRQEFTDGGELLLMQNDGYLYLGLHENFDGLATASVCIAYGDKVSIVHSSASLGTAIFLRDGAEWQVTQTFHWELQELIANTEDAEQQRRVFLEENNWLANIGLMTATEEFEYKIAIPGGSFYLAAAYLLPPNFGKAAWWPASLADDCRKVSLLRGNSGQEMSTPLRLKFSPTTWASITIP
jgi:hypothetical protein